jgi:integrase
MTRIRVKGFQIFSDRHGKMRCYHRSTRRPVNLVEAPLGSAEFFAECARISELKKLSGPPKPGTLGLLIIEYRASPEFLDREPRTRADYQRCLDYLKPISDVPLTCFDRALVVRIRDKAGVAHGRRFGNYVKAVLSILFAWGAERGYVEKNPAEKVRNVRKKRGTPDANRPWSDEERYVVLDSCPPHMRPAIALMMFTGLSPKDALRLQRSHYQEGEIATRRSKTGEPVFWPAPSALMEVMRAAPSHNAVTLCANSRGRPWTESGFHAEEDSRPT